MIIKLADTGDVPPASGVIVNAVVLPAGFLTVSVEFSVSVVIINVPEILLVPVALPITV